MSEANQLVIRVKIFVKNSRAKGEFQERDLDVRFQVSDVRLKQVSGFRLNVRESEKAPLWRRYILMFRLQKLRS